jgi:hypothetical protein
MMKLAVIVSAVCLSAMPVLAGASQGGVSRLYQTQCYPGVGCWPLGYGPPIAAYDSVSHGVSPFYHNGAPPHR